MTESQKRILTEPAPIPALGAAEPAVADEDVRRMWRLAQEGKRPADERIDARPNIPVPDAEQCATLRVAVPLIPNDGPADPAAPLRAGASRTAGLVPGLEVVHQSGFFTHLNRQLGLELHASTLAATSDRAIQSGRTT